MLHASYLVGTGLAPSWSPPAPSSSSHPSWYVSLIDPLHASPLVGTGLAPSWSPPAPVIVFSSPAPFSFFPHLHFPSPILVSATILALSPTLVPTYPLVPAPSWHPSSSPPSNPHTTIFPSFKNSTSSTHTSPLRRRSHTMSQCRADWLTPPVSG